MELVQMLNNNQSRLSEAWEDTECLFDEMTKPLLVMCCFTKVSPTSSEQAIIFERDTACSFPVALPNTLLGRGAVSAVWANNWISLCFFFSFPPRQGEGIKHDAWHPSVCSTYLHLHCDWIPCVITHDSDTSGEIDKGNYHEPPKALVQAWLEMA